MGRKRWELISYDKDRATELAELTGEDPFAVLLAHSRGCDTPEAIYDFFHAASQELSSPFLIKDMDIGAARIRRAIENGERILVYGDYDADGVTATALLYTYLLNTGADADYYIPSRVADGYGLSSGTAEKVLEGGYSLVVTVDNGIAAIEEAKFFKAHGVDLVVTDHHQAGETLPDCVAVIDPHRPDDPSPFKELAGVGVAFKLAAALEDGEYAAVLDDYLDIVTLGTIADIVPLTGENRTLVSRGLAAIQNTSRPGLIALMESLSLGDKAVNSSTVAFALAPKINAAGRMGTADDALELLITEDFDRAAELAQSLQQLNTARQTTENQILSEVTALFERDRSYASDPVLVVAGKGWHPGVIGIVASRLVDTYGKPAFVISVPESGDAKGSCRSLGDFSLYEALQKCAPYLTKFGGHTLAAGFSVTEENIPKFRRAMNDCARAFGEIVPALPVDCRLNPVNLSLGVLDSIALLEPFGASNPGPVFGLMGLQLTGVRGIASNKHLRLTLTKQNATLTALYFGQTPDAFPYAPGDTVDLAVRLEKNEYMGQTSLSIQVRDIRPAGTDDTVLFPALAALHRAERGQALNENEKRLLLPDRRLIERVFTYIKNHPGCRLSGEVIAVRCGEPPANAPKVYTALAALTELGILKRQNGALYVSVGVKASLTASKLLLGLGYRG